MWEAKAKAMLDAHEQAEAGRVCGQALARVNRTIVSFCVTTSISCAEIDGRQGTNITAQVSLLIGQLEHAPRAYKTFSDGSPKKFVIDPHGSVKKAA